MDTLIESISVRQISVPLFAPHYESGNLICAVLGLWAKWPRSPYGSVVFHHDCGWLSGLTEKLLVFTQVTSRYIFSMCFSEVAEKKINLLKLKSILKDYKLPSMTGSHSRQLTGGLTSTGKRAAKSKLPTSASMPTWAAMLTLTLPVPPFTELPLLATRVGSPVTRWPLTPPNQRWLRATLLLATKRETFSCTPMCKLNTCYSHL